MRDGTNSKTDELLTKHDNTNHEINGNTAYPESTKEKTATHLENENNIARKNSNVNTHSTKLDKINKLKEDLRHEEAKLLLLQLINQSQNIKDSTNDRFSNNTNNSALSDNRYHVKERDRKRPIASNELSHSVSMNNRFSSSVDYSSNSNVMPLLPKRTKLMDIGSPTSSTNLESNQNINTALVNTSYPPKIIYVGSINPIQSSTLTRSGLPPELKTASTTTNNTRVITTNKRAQKVALRQQLDNLLRQLPKPEPYSQPWKVIPNGSNSRFSMLLGLELVAERVTKTDSTSKSISKSSDATHLACADCKTDCTSMWNLLNDDDGNIKLLCIECVTKTRTKSSLENYKAILDEIITKSKEVEKGLANNEPSGSHSGAATSQVTASISGQDATITNSTPILHTSQYQQHGYRPQADYIYQVPQSSYVPFNPVTQHFRHPHLASLSTQSFVNAQQSLERRQREHLLNMIQRPVPLEWN
ncbi:uncharacterized protein TRIADDRAFT_60364 [Trichoplax adhaerens]|uniref:Transcriptional repressor p66 coiled-coil MBD2-interaction domain-containing protein n=1 Tax=Trichoplax adhaerens TaxID=10228 RepID=B3S807_TRIAD|nr:hypothetical protein TRIADDRAFT_60364 [Trichoplax adhaerens]EDV21109.1 hypothetical protein TRIADDRAFT_60364 [Trichoplax adhaerens]|eukprot:XP_002116439.1 hypothetical protein TRIADDRAFT_60364 [Trichoplax adhaerens]